MYILRHFKLVDVVFLFSVDFMGLVMGKICQCFRFLLSISVHYRWVLYDFACNPRSRIALASSYYYNLLYLMELT